jgi:hypothetical protein
MQISYPVAIDSGYGVWEAFANHYWPALYFVDAAGRIRHHVFGEGDYDRSELVIQELLREAGVDAEDRPLVSVAGAGLEAAADWDDLRTGETYLGSARGSNLASPEPVAGDERGEYTLPPRLGLNHWALSGSWTVGSESVLLEEPGGRIAFRFSARDLHLVIAPATPGGSARFRVRLDGRAPGAAHGADVDEKGDGLASEQRLYQLVRQPLPVAERHFEIEFLDAGVRAVVFTFG